LENDYFETVANANQRKSIERFTSHREAASFLWVAFEERAASFFINTKTFIMLHKEKNISVSSSIILFLVFSNALILKIAFVQNEKWYALLVVTLPLLLVAIYHLREKRA